MADYETTRDGRTVEVRRSGTPGWLIALLVIVALVIAAFAFGLVNIDQVREGKVPEIAVTGGEAPKFDVDTARIDIGSKKETVEVPTINVERADDPNRADK